MVFVCRFIFDLIMPGYQFIAGSLIVVVVLAAWAEITNWLKCQQILTYSVHELHLLEEILCTTSFYEMLGCSQSNKNQFWQCSHYLIILLIFHMPHNGIQTANLTLH
jgi:hypothetical protein